MTDGPPDPEALTLEEVEALLSAWTVSPARAAFRARLRRPFTGEGPAESTSRGGPATRTAPRGSMDVERILLEGSPPPAREAFRLALREAFCSGSIAEGEHELRPLRPRRTAALRRGLVVLAAAAAVVLTVVLATSERPEPGGWRVVDVTGEGPLEVDRSPVGHDDRGGLARGLADERRLSSGRNTLELVYRDAVRLEVRPGTTWRTLPVAEAAGLHVELERGEIFLRTLAAHDGAPVTVSTAQGEVVLAGTVLGVLADDEGTCVCVVEGAVRMTCPGHGGGPPEVHHVASHESLRVPSPEGPIRPMPFPEDGHHPHIADLLAFASL